MSNFENQLGNHPILGLLMSCSAVVLGTVLDTVNALQNTHIPPFIIESFQILSYVGAICIAIVTVHSWYKKNFFKDENK
jgi:hypothetical protein